MRRRDPAQPVYRITAVQRSRREDLRARQRRYIVSMTIRTICFMLAVATSGWVRWTFAIGALVLPYFAVVIANAARPTEEPPPLLAPTRSRTALEPRPPHDE